MSTRPNTIKENKDLPEILGIDIGSHKIRASLTVGRRKKSDFEVFSNGVQNGYIVNQKDFENDILDLLSNINYENKSVPRRIIVGVSTRSCDSVTAAANIITGRSDGLITDNDIDECIKKAKAKLEINKNLEILHSIVMKKIVDDQVVQGEIVGLKGSKVEMRVLFILEDRKTLKTVYDTFADNNLEIDQIVSGPFAESLITLNRKDMRLGAASINIGLNNTSVVVYENNYPLLCSIISGGGENVTSDLSLGLRMSYSESEDIKQNINKSETAKRRVEEIIEARVNYLDQKINEELKRIKRSELLPAGVILSGGSSYIYKIEQNMRYDLKIPISSCEKNIANTGCDAENIRSYSIAMLYDKNSEGSIYFEYMKKTYRFIISKIKKFLP
jgi:cell division protein FtsA